MSKKEKKMDLKYNFVNNLLGKLITEKSFVLK